MADAFLAQLSKLQQKIGVHQESWTTHLASVRSNGPHVDVNSSNNTKASLLLLHRRCCSVRFRIETVMKFTQIGRSVPVPSVEELIVNAMEAPLGTETSAYRLEVAIEDANEDMAKCEEKCVYMEDRLTNMIEEVGKEGRNLECTLRLQKVMEACEFGVRCRARREEAEDRFWKASEGLESLDLELFHELWVRGRQQKGLRCF